MNKRRLPRIAFSLTGTRRRNVIAIGAFLLFYVAFGAHATAFQERIAYHPGSRDFADCPELSDAEQVSFKGTRMYVHDTGGRFAVIYHGNAGTACDRAFIADVFVKAGYSYALPEYAGYAGGEGFPSHERVKEDVKNVVSYLKTLGRGASVVFGESIGTGAASYHASLASVDRIVLVSPFTDLAAVARRHFWYYPTAWLVDDAFDNEALLAGFSGRALIVHGDADATVPVVLGKELFASLDAKQKRLSIIPGAGHDDLYDFPETLAAIKNFIR